MCLLHFRNLFTWHLRYIVQTSKLFDCSVTSVYRMLRNIPFPVRCIANLPDPIMSLNIWPSWLRRPLAHTSTPVAGMPALMQCVRDMVDNRTGSTVRLGWARSSFFCAGYSRLYRQQFWMMFDIFTPTAEWMNERVSLICLGSCVFASLNVCVAMIAIQDGFPDVERRLAGFITLYAGEISGIRSMAKCYYSSFIQ